MECEQRGVRWRAGSAPAAGRLSCESDDETIIFSSLCVRGVPDIISYVDRGRRWRWVSGLQYLPDGPGDACALVTSGGRPVPLQSVGDSTDRQPYDIQCVRWTAAFLSIVKWWSEHGRSRFGCTIGRLSLDLLRSTVKPKDLCQHNDDDGHRVERSSAYGGRATTWCYAPVGAHSSIVRSSDAWNVVHERPDVRGPITLVDARSMYPFLMRQLEFPCKLLSHRHDMSVSGLIDLARHTGVIARVTINARSPEYPYRDAERVQYPLGRFVTTLTGPELLEASYEDSLERVHEVCVYKMGRPFERFADVLLAERQRMRDSGDAVSELFIKYLSNSLSGKLAQRSGQWERSQSDDTPGEWGERWEINVQTRARRRLHYVCGLAWQWSDEQSHVGPYTFAYAYLTAYGRLFMRRLRSLCPPRTVVSQDTDGLWLLPDGLDALTHPSVSWGSEPGDMRVVQVAQSGRWYGPRHYCADGRWTLAGFHQPTVSAEGVAIHDTATTSLWSGRYTETPTTITTFNRESVLSLDCEGGSVGEDGWLRPRRWVGRRLT